MNACCSVVQCGAACCVHMERPAVRGTCQNRPINICALQCGAVCCVCCSVLMCVVISRLSTIELPTRVGANVLRCVAVCCSVLQCVAVCGSVLPLYHMTYRHGAFVRVRCSVLQRVAAYCSVLQRIAVWCSELQCVAVCCSVWHCVTSLRSNVPSRRVRASVLQHVAVLQCVAVCCSVLQCGAVWCSVLHLCYLTYRHGAFVRVCCSVLQRVAVCCIVLQCVAMN